MEARGRQNSAVHCCKALVRVGRNKRNTLRRITFDSSGLGTCRDFFLLQWAVHG